MKNKIIIPVDFSEYSQQAIDYACQLNNIVAHDIDLIHVFIDVNNIYHQSQIDSENIDYKVTKAKRDAEELIVKYKNIYPEIKFNIIYKDGNLFDELHKITSQEHYDAIIMGTKGALGLEALLVGSNTFEVFQNTTTPVLAVPKVEKQLKTDRIGLLCNFKNGELDVLKQAINVYGKDFELILIHINTSNESIESIDTKFKLFINRIIDETGIDNISYVIKAQAFLVQYKEDISSAINTVISDELIDALLVTKSKKGFLRKVIEENVVKKMAYEIHIPKFFGKS